MYLYCTITPSKSSMTPVEFVIDDDADMILILSSLGGGGGGGGVSHGGESRWFIKYCSFTTHLLLVNIYHLITARMVRYVCVCPGLLWVNTHSSKLISLRG